MPGSGAAIFGHVLIINERAAEDFELAMLFGCSIELLLYSIEVRKTEVLREVGGITFHDTQSTKAG